MDACSECGRRIDRQLPQLHPATGQILTEGFLCEECWEEYSQFAADEKRRRQADEEQTWTV